MNIRWMDGCVDVGGKGGIRGQAVGGRAAREVVFRG
jgi:hypothetical protein